MIFMLQTQPNGTSYKIMRTFTKMSGKRNNVLIAPMSVTNRDFMETSAGCMPN